MRYSKLIIGCILSSGIVISMFLAVSYAQQAPKPIELQFNFLWPPQAQQVTDGYAPWFAEIEKRTGGRVKINPHYLNSLAPIQEAYNAALTGLADISEIDLQLHPGMFPMYDVVYYGFPSTKYSRFTRNFWILQKEFPKMREEWNKVKLLYAWSMGPNRIESVKPVRKLEDAKGIKLAGMGDKNPRYSQALGFTGVSLPPMEVYTAIDKGVVDGATMTSDSLVSFRLAEVVKYHTYVSIGGTLFVVTMNKAKWDSLPSDIQKIFDDVSEKWAMDFWDNAMFKMEKKSIQYGIDHGVEAIDLSSEETAKWDPKIKPLQEKYIESLEKKNLPGKELIDRYIKLIDQNEM